jgi:SPW repeat
MVRPNITMDDHPDMLEMRARYDRVALTPTAQSVDGATLLAGVYLAISPWVVGFRPVAPDLTANNLICGIAVALLGLGYATVYGRTHGLSWVTPVIGAWVIVSPWVVRGTNVDAGMILNNVISGAVITILGLVTLGLGARRGPVLGREHH